MAGYFRRSSLLLSLKVRCCFFLLALLTLGVSTTEAQPVNSIWTQQKTFNSPIVCIHFLDSSAGLATGFVGLADGSIWRTSDAGANWALATGGSSMPISSFSFKDSVTGWATVRGSQQMEGVLKTKDGGLTWSGADNFGSKNCVFYNPTSKRLFVTSSTGNVSVSSNEGLIWDDMDVVGKTGIAFSDGLSGVITNALGNNIYTTDGGVSWKNGNLSMECWQPLGIPGTKTFFAASEINRTVWRSDDGGKSWKQIYQFKGLDSALTGTIRGNCSQLFVQTAVGVAFSSDAGNSWADMGIGNGPETRFFFTGVRLHVAEDRILWVKTIDNDGYVSPLKLSRDTIFIRPQGCRPADSALDVLVVDGCSPTKLVKATIVGPSTFSIATQLTLPQQISTLKLRYQSSVTATEDARLELIFQRNATRFDTAVVQLIGRRSPSLKYTVTPLLLNLTAKNGCTPIDTFITIGLDTCEPADLQITITDPTFTVPGVTFPVTLQPGSFYRLPIRATTLKNGLQTGTLKLHLSNPEMFRDTNISLRFQVLSPFLPTLNMSAKTVTFPATNLCNSKEATVVLSNSMCRPTKITSLTWQVASPEFTLLHQPLINKDYAPGESDSIVIKFQPTSISTPTALLKLSLDMDGILRDTTIRINGTGISTSRAVLTNNTLYFNTLHSCETEELTTYLHNESCSPMQFQTASVGTANGFTLLEPTAAVTVPQGDSVKVRVLFTPGAMGQKKDAVTLRVSLESQTQDVQLYLVGDPLPPERKIEMSMGAITLDSIDGCSPIDTVIWLKNLGTCDVKTFGALIVTGTNGWFSLTAVPNAGDQFKPGDSVGFHLIINPGTLHDASGTVQIAGIDTTVSITITSHICDNQNESELSLAPYDPHIITEQCKVVTKQFSLTNSGPATTVDLSLTPVIAGSTQYSFNPPITGTQTVPANGTFTFGVQFDPDGTGDGVSTLHIASASLTNDVRLDATVNNTKQTPRLSISSISPTRGHPGEFVEVDLKTLDPISNGIALGTLDFALSLNTDLLDPIVADGANGWTADPLSNTLNSVSVRLHAPAGAIAAGTTLGTVRLRAAIAEAEETSITLASPRFNASDPNYERCTLAALSTGESIPFQIVNSCGDKIIRDVMLHRLNLQVISVNPNPVRESSHGVKVTMSLEETSDVTIELSDALGNKKSFIAKPGVEAGTTSIEVPSDGLAEGMYFIRVTAGNDRMTRKIQIVK